MLGRPAMRFHAVESSRHTEGHSFAVRTCRLCVDWCDGCGDVRPGRTSAARRPDFLSIDYLVNQASEYFFENRGMIGIFFTRLLRNIGVIRRRSNFRCLFVDIYHVVSFLPLLEPFGEVVWSRHPGSAPRGVNVESETCICTLIRDGVAAIVDFFEKRQVA
jgi:hypothetical protein